MAFFRPGNDNKPQKGTSSTSDRTEMLTNFTNNESSSSDGDVSNDVTKNLEGFDGGTVPLSKAKNNPFDPNMIMMDDEEDVAEPVADEGKTRVIGSYSIPSSTDKVEKGQSHLDDELHPKGEVTGWLVVVHGPQKGESFALRHGPQIISRGEEADVPLKDPAVSRNKQATVHYDPNMGEFSLYRGQSTPNMYTVRAGKTSSLHVGMNHILELGDELVFGDNLSTRLRFVPLCGPDFSWRDLD